MQTGKIPAERVVIVSVFNVFEVMKRKSKQSNQVRYTHFTVAITSQAIIAEKIHYCRNFFEEKLSISW